MGLYKEVFEDRHKAQDFTFYQDQINKLKEEVYRLSQDRLMAIEIIKEYKSRIVDLKATISREKLASIELGGDSANNE